MNVVADPKSMFKTSEAILAGIVITTEKKSNWLPLSRKYNEGPVAIILIADSIVKIMAKK